MKTRDRRGETMCDGVRTELITFICFITALNTNEAFAATAGRLPVIGAVSRVLTFRNYDTADEEKEIHMEIQQIQEPEAGSTSSPLAADVNKEIETIMEAYRRDAQQRIEEYKEAFLATGGTEEAFAEKGLIIDVVQTRKPMGLPKIQHIRELLSMPEVNEQFATRYQRAWTEEDVVELNRLFEKHLFASLENYTDPIPGVIPTLEKLRAEGLKIGSTTGYTREMMNVVLPAAQAKGYRVDYCATPNLLPAGRPAPYMIFENLIKLGVDSLDAVVKVGDTIADIKEGVNAKVCSVGVVLGSNEMALTEAETKAMPAAELEARIADVKERMFAAGASYVILSMEELPALIERMNADR